MTRASQTEGTELRILPEERRETKQRTARGERKRQKQRRALRGEGTRDRPKHAKRSQRREGWWWWWMDGRMDEWMNDDFTRFYVSVDDLCPMQVLECQKSAVHHVSNPPNEEVAVTSGRMMRLMCVRDTERRNKEREGGSKRASTIREQFILSSPMTDDRDGRLKRKRDKRKERKKEKGKPSVTNRIIHSAITASFPSPMSSMHCLPPRHLTWLSSRNLLLLFPPQPPPPHHPHHTSWLEENGSREQWRTRVTKQMKINKEIVEMEKKDRWPAMEQIEGKGRKQNKQEHRGKEKRWTRLTSLEGHEQTNERQIEREIRKGRKKKKRRGGGRYGQNRIRANGEGDGVTTSMQVMSFSRSPWLASKTMKSSSNVEVEMRAMISSTEAVKAENKETATKMKRWETIRTWNKKRKRKKKESHGTTSASNGDAEIRAMMPSTEAVRAEETDEERQRKEGARKVQDKGGKGKDERKAIEREEKERRGKESERKKHSAGGMAGRETVKKDRERETERRVANTVEELKDRQRWRERDRKGDTRARAVPDQVRERKLRRRVREAAGRRAEARSLLPHPTRPHPTERRTEGRRESRTTRSQKEPIGEEEEEIRLKAKNKEEERNTKVGQDQERKEADMKEYGETRKGKREGRPKRELVEAELEEQTDEGGRKTERC